MLNYNLRKTSLKAFSHQRRAKPFNALRSKADSFEKKPFLSQKAISNLTQVFLDKKQFLQKSYYCQKAVSGQKVLLSLIHF